MAGKITVLLLNTNNSGNITYKIYKLENKYCRPMLNQMKKRFNLILESQCIALSFKNNFLYMEIKSHVP